jgi:hypothetical protein
MAEKPKVNKSQAIKDYLKAHPGVGNTEVANSLTKSGLKMTANYVATIKGKMKVRRKKVKKVVKKVVATRGIGIPEVKAAFALMKLTGGVAGAKHALEAAQEIKMML